MDANARTVINSCQVVHEHFSKQISVQKHCIETALLLSLCQTDQTHQEADGKRGEAVHKDPADAPRDAGQEGMFPGACEYFDLARAVFH